MKVILLPGLDGTGSFFAPFVEACPAGFSTRVVRYPPRERIGYEGLHRIVESELPLDAPWLLVAESFSTPLAIAIAAGAPAGLRGVVLCAGFATSPWNPRLRFAVSPLLFRLPLPRWAIRRYLLADRTECLEAAFRSCLREVAPAVLAGRLRLLLAVDQRALVARCAVPLLYLRATRDRLVPARCVREIRERSTTCEVRDVDAPHFVLQHSPAAAWEAIAAFARSLPE